MLCSVWILEALPSAVKRGIRTTGPTGASLRAALKGETEQQKDALSGSLQKLATPGPFSPSLPSPPLPELRPAQPAGGQSPDPARCHPPPGSQAPAGPPCPCARGFGCGSTGRCRKHTRAPPPRPPGCGPPGQGGGAAGGSAGRPCPVSPTSWALLPEGLAARQRRGGWDSGRAAASGWSVPGSGPAAF